MAEHTAPFSSPSYLQQQIRRHEVALSAPGFERMKAGALQAARTAAMPHSPFAQQLWRIDGPQRLAALVIRSLRGNCQTAKLESRAARV